MFTTGGTSREIGAAKSLSGDVYMSAVGMIHLACYCGAELFILGESPGNLSNHDIVEILHEKLGPGDFGILRPADDLRGECPFCGLIYELPEPRLLQNLPYAEHGRVRSALSNYRQSHAHNGEFSPDVSARGRYLS